MHATDGSASSPISVRGELMPRSMRIPIIGLAAALALGGALVAPAPALAAAGCQVTYTTNDWNTGPGQGGFGASVTVQNLGEPITSWTLRFSFPAGQQVQAG